MVCTSPRRSSEPVPRPHPRKRNVRAGTGRSAKRLQRRSCPPGGAPKGRQPSRRGRPRSTREPEVPRRKPPSALSSPVSYHLDGITRARDSSIIDRMRCRVWKPRSWTVEAVASASSLERKGPSPTMASCIPAGGATAQASMRGTTPISSERRPTYSTVLLDHGDHRERSPESDRPRG